MIYKKKIKPKWGNIKVIQKKLAQKQKKCEKDYIDSIKMVTGELLENSVKYYYLKGIKKPIEFHFSNSNGISISILNQKIDHEDMDAITGLIDSINSSDNPYKLFVDRLQDILIHRVKGESKLGLLRVVSDGDYTLSYTKGNGTLDIYANKKVIGENVEMKNLDYEDLTIEVTELESYVKVSWIGKSRALNPETILDPYLTMLTKFLKGKNVIVSFEKLESMNSSTVPPLLSFIRNLEEKGISSIFLYNDKEDWQRASFKPLSVITGKYKNVKIKALSSHVL